MLGASGLGRVYILGRVSCYLETVRGTNFLPPVRNFEFRIKV